MLRLLLSVFSATTPIPVITSSSCLTEGNKQRPSSNVTQIRFTLLFKALLWFPTVWGRHPKSLPWTPKQACHDLALVILSILIVPHFATITLLQAYWSLCVTCLALSCPRTFALAIFFVFCLKHFSPGSSSAGSIPPFRSWSSFLSSERLSLTSRSEAVSGHSPANLR